MSKPNNLSQADRDELINSGVALSSTLTDADLKQLEIDLIQAPTFKLAFEDDDFIGQRDLRGVRLQLEMRKPDMALKALNIRSTIVVFGGTRILSEEQSLAKIAVIEKQLKESPDSPELQHRLRVAQNVLAKSHFYDEARKFGRLVSSQCQVDGKCDYVIVTGGGPGVMEAANRGAFDINAKTIGLNIVLPEEQAPNPYITPELCFQFHYFAIRKMHFLMRARALVVFPGGYGTLDEMFEALTLVQTGRARVLPIILFGQEFWEKIINFDSLVDEGVINPEDKELFRFAETADEAWKIIQDANHLHDGEIT